MCLMPYANNKDADQPAHAKDRMIPLVYEGFIWDLILSVPDNCLSFYFKYTAMIQTSSAQKPGACGNKSVCFSTAQDVCSKLQNQAKYDSADFKTISRKSYCVLHILIIRTSFSNVS